MQTNLKHILGDDPLYDEVQKVLTKYPKLTAGDIVRAGIRQWLDDARDAEQEGTFEDFSYYSTLTSSERQEDKEWGEIAAASAAEIWPVIEAK